MEQWAFCKWNIPGVHSLKHNQPCREDELYWMIPGLALPFGAFSSSSNPPPLFLLLLLFSFYVFVTRITMIKVNDSEGICLENWGIKHFFSLQKSKQRKRCILSEFIDNTNRTYRTNSNTSKITLCNSGRLSRRSLGLHNKCFSSLHYLNSSDRFL